MPKDLDSEIARDLKSIVDHFEREDRAVYERQLRRYRRLKLYWNNLSMIYWDEGANDYRLATAENTEDDQAYYDRPVNIFKAFLETIIAAMSIQMTRIVCVPEDADNPMDNSTAKAGNKIAEKIYKDNNALFLWLHMIYIYCTEGMIACYSYPKEDKKFGTYDEKIFKDKEVESYACPNCGAQLNDDIFMEQSDEDYMSAEVGEEDEIMKLNMGTNCPNCDAPLDPNMQKTLLKVPEFDRVEKKPKTRICMEMYGGLYVKIANYAMNQKDTPYLRFAYETHFANVLAKYPDLRGKLKDKQFHTGSALDPYEQTARLNPQYRGETPDNNVTVRNIWFRPKAFYVLPEDKCKKLERKFPNGVKIELANECVANYEAENLDDRWTLTRQPLSDYLTHEPLGELLTNIQDIVNDLISLTLQTIEHGIEQTWADPSTVNFEGQSQLEANPGIITPTKPQAGKNISDAFFSTKPATLSPEVIQFYRIIQELAQFVSGALPSIFGGASVGKSSQTASEYAMSRTQALQRLQTPWMMFSIFWKEIFLKVIPQYMELIKQDEKFVKRDEQTGGFVNVLIKKADLVGSIGDIEMDPSDKMPVSDDEKRQLIMELFGLNNVEIMTALTSPENLPMVRKVVRIPEFRLPGEADRQKQLEEIRILLSEQPQTMEVPPEMLLAMDPNNPIPRPERSSIPIDPLVDNNIIEAETCRFFLVSEAGRLAKEENPPGYRNVVLHMKEHLDAETQKMMAAAVNTTQPPPNGQKPEGKETGPEVKGEEDVNTPIR